MSAPEPQPEALVDLDEVSRAIAPAPVESLLPAPPAHQPAAGAASTRSRGGQPKSVSFGLELDDTSAQGTKRADAAVNLAQLTSTIKAEQVVMRKVRSRRHARSGTELWTIARTHMRAYTNVVQLMQDTKAFHGEDDLDKLQGIHEELQRLSNEEDKEEPTSCCLFMPDDLFRTLWDIAQTVSLIWVAITIPLFATFGIEYTTRDFLFWWDAAIDLYFVVDVVIQFRTAYWDDRGYLVTDLLKIRRSYMHGWFILDFVSCLPVGYVSMILEGPGEDGTDLRAIKILRLLRLAKLLRLQRLQRLLDRYADAIQEVAQAAQAIFVPIIVILYISHVLACLNYVAGTHVEFQPNPHPGRTILGWAACAEHEPDEFGNTRTCKSGVENDGSFDAILTLYLMAFHAVSPKLFSLMDYHPPPFSNGMLLFAIIAEFICTIVFGWLTSSLNTYLSTGKLAKQQYQHRMETLTEFLRVKEVPFTVRRKIRMYYENFYKHKSVFDETEILKHLPPTMASELVYCMYRGIITNCPLFRDLSEELVSKICVTLHPYATTAGDVIIREGTTGTDLYLIILGKVLVTSSGVAVCVLKDGSFFGEMGLLAAASGDFNATRTKTATAVTNCELCFLPRTAGLKLLEKHSDFRERLLHFSISRQHRDSVRAAVDGTGDEAQELEARKQLLSKMAGMSMAMQRDILEDPFKSAADSVAGYKTHEIFQASKLASAASKLKYASRLKEEQITDEQLRFADAERADVNSAGDAAGGDGEGGGDKHGYKATASATKGLRAKRDLIRKLGRDGATQAEDSAVVAVAGVLDDLSARVDTVMHSVRSDFGQQVESINKRFDRHAGNQEALLKKLGQLLDSRR